MEDYLKILNESYEQVKAFDECLDTKEEYLGDHIFNFTTYDGEISARFALKALEVCEAITGKKTFEYIKDTKNYEWFLLMCNMPFFEGKLEWGTSIRGCWWDDYSGIELETCGLFIDDKQVLKKKFNGEEWRAFIGAMRAFLKETK